VEEVQCRRRKVGLDWENETSIFFIIVFVLIGSVSAIPNDADSSIDFTYPDSTNYSTINVNDSIYWDGNAWSDARWLNIDGGNANQNIDIGAWNFSASHFIGDGSLLTGIPSYWDRVGTVLSPSTVGDDITTTGNVHINRLFVNDYFFHTGDLDTYFGFGDNFAKISTGGETHFQINPSGNNIALGDDTHAMDIILRPTASGSVKIGADTGLYLGAADDSSISYDGTDMVINPQEVGTGGLEVLGDLTTTGTGTFGDATIGNGYTGDCVNTTFVSGIATGCND